MLPVVETTSSRISQPNNLNIDPASSPEFNKAPQIRTPNFGAKVKQMYRSREDTNNIDTLPGHPVQIVDYSLLLTSREV